MVFVRGTIDHINLVFGENHLNIIPKNLTLEFYKNFDIYPHLWGKIKYASQNQKSLRYTLYITG